MSRRLLVALWAVVGLVVIIGGPLFATLHDSSRPEPRTPPLDLASAAAAHFVQQYVDPDGRVVRRDQGNDTVSEGQAYGMLVAVGINDRKTFDSIWDWTKTNLAQPNGLFAWQWQNGRVLDPQPATDADMDIARALVVASTQFKQDSYAQEARALGKSIADNEMSYAQDGKPVLLAGPWAKSTLPFYVNPSYHSPRTEEVLAGATDDTRWPSALERQRSMMTTLLGSRQNPRLPPDWAVVNLDGSVRAVGPPSSPGDQPRYSYDGLRTPIRLAESCDAADRAQAAQIWSVVNESRERRTSPALKLDGDVITDDGSAIGAVASAAGAKAAGDTQQMSDLLDQADRLDSAQHTYYGSAWAALGRIMLTTNWLGSC